MSPVVVRRGPSPWVWVLIALAAIILVFVIWFAIAAQNQQETIIVPGGGQETTPPTTGQAPSQPAPSQQTPSQPTPPQSAPPQTGTNVNIYVGKDQNQPNVVVVPKGGQAPSSASGMQQVNLPGEFRYSNTLWKVSRQAVAGDNANLKKTGDSTGGKAIYAEQSAQEPYDHVYLETRPGSGIFLRYDKSS
jgi:hypothetical protein